MTRTRSSAAFHRTVWRWHFYAGLAVAPFLFILAVTGAIYLFNDEINDVLYRDLRIVAPVAHPVPLGRVVEAAVAAHPGGTATRVYTPPSVDRSVEVFVTPAAGDPVRVFVDPGTGHVLGSYVYAHTLVGFADVAHGSLMLGDTGDAVVELAACWGFILTVTGLYLWWPRGRSLAAGFLYPHLNRRGRAAWREWHGVTGAWCALLVMFLILTGLPWATLWGGLLRTGTDLAGIGYPASYRSHGAAGTSGPTVGQAAAGAAPWTLEAAPMPVSDPHAGHHGSALASHPPGHGGGLHPLDVDAVAAVLEREGMRSPYRLTLPADATSVFTAFSYPDQPETQRTLHIDQYSGRVLGDIRFADYGWAAKAVELGVQLHMGNYFGRLNQLVMLVPCIGIVALTLTGPVMWWRRRPKGRIGAPSSLDPSPARLRVLVPLVLGLGLVFPLAGASLAVVLVLDRAVRWLSGRWASPGPETPAA